MLDSETHILINELIALNGTGLPIKTFKWPKDYWTHKSTYPIGYNPAAAFRNSIDNLPVKRGHQNASTNKRKEAPVMMSLPRMQDLSDFDTIMLGVYFSTRNRTLVWIHESLFNVYIPYCSLLKNKARKRLGYWVVAEDVFLQWLESPLDEKRSQWKNRTKAKPLLHEVITTKNTQSHKLRKAA